MKEIITYNQSEKITTAFIDDADDMKVITMFLHGKSKNSIKRYSFDIQLFLDFVKKPLRKVTLPDVMNFTDSLNGTDSTRASRIKSIKSLFSFAFKIGYLITNIAVMVKIPDVKNTLNERILSINEIKALLKGANNERDYAVIRLLFYGKLRISELTNLQIKDIRFQDDSMILAIFGKGGKTRFIRISEQITINAVKKLVADASADNYVFRSNGSPITGDNVGGKLDESAIHRVIKAIAKRSNINKSVSAHWLRHSGASDSVNNGSPLHVVQSDLGHSSITTTQIYLHVSPNQSSSNYQTII